MPKLVFRSKRSRWFDLANVCLKCAVKRVDSLRLFGWEGIARTVVSKRWGFCRVRNVWWIGLPSNRIQRQFFIAYVLFPSSRVSAWVGKQLGWSVEYARLTVVVGSELSEMEYLVHEGFLRLKICWSVSDWNLEEDSWHSGGYRLLQHGCVRDLEFGSSVCLAWAGYDGGWSLCTSDCEDLRRAYVAFLGNCQ